MSQHLAEAELNDYLDGSLPGTERAALEEHLAACARCQAEAAAQMFNAAGVDLIIAVYRRVELAYFLPFAGVSDLGFDGYLFVDDAQFAIEGDLADFDLVEHRKRAFDEFEAETVLARLGVLAEKAVGDERSDKTGRRALVELTRTGNVSRAQLGAVNSST